MRNVATNLSTEDAERLERVLRDRDETSYAFIKEAILRAIREAEGQLGPEAPSAVVEEMIEVLGQRKRYLYQSVAYSDGNHRTWLAGRFPQATKREVVEAVATWRAAGGKT